MNVSRTVCEEGKGKAMGEWFESMEKNNIYNFNVTDDC